MTPALPPQLLDVDGERAVLGLALIHGPDALADFYRLTEPVWFGVPEHRDLARVLRAIATKGLPAEIAVLREQCRALGVAMPDADTLAALVDEAPGPSTLPHFAATLRDRHDRREAWLTLHAQADRAALLDIPLSETAAAAALALSTTASPERPTLSQTLLDAMEGIEREGKNDMPPGWTLDLPKLDRMTRGFQAGQLVLIAARPGVGKTQLALQLAWNVLQAEHAVLFATHEMTPVRLMRRLVALVAGVDLLQLVDRHYPKLAHAAGQIATWPLVLDGRSHTPGALRLECQRMARESEKPALVIVDFLQLFGPDGRAENRNLEVGAVARGLQRLAIEEEVTVVALSQLSRASEHGERRRPRLTDLRDSGELEQAADQVLFLHRIETDDVTEGHRRVDAILDKNRDGLTGTVPLVVNGAGRWHEAIRLAGREAS